MYYDKTISFLNSLKPHFTARRIGSLRSFITDLRVYTSSSDKAILETLSEKHNFSLENIFVSFVERTLNILYEIGNEIPITILDIFTFNNNSSLYAVVDMGVVRTITSLGSGLNYITYNFGTQPLENYYYLGENFAVSVNSSLTEEMLENIIKFVPKKMPLKFVSLNDNGAYFKAPNNYEVFLPKNSVNLNYHIYDLNTANFIDNENFTYIFKQRIFEEDIFGIVNYLLVNKEQAIKHTNPFYEMNRSSIFYLRDKIWSRNAVYSAFNTGVSYNPETIFLDCEVEVDGELFNINDVLYDNNIEEFIENVEHEKTICNVCGEVIDKSEGFYQDNTYYCADCLSEYFIECPNCGGFVLRDFAYYSNLENEHYCDTCYNDIFRECAECGTEIYVDDSYYSEEHDCYYCQDCYQDIRCDVDEEKIKSYYYEPDWEKQGIDGKNRYFGVEIETDTSTWRKSFEKFDSEFDIEANENWVFAKEDGSITGIEVVTHPATLSEWKNNDRYKELIDALYDSYDYEGRSSGIHIHIDRKAFRNDFAIVKLIYIFNKLFESSEILDVSLREEGRLESWARKNNRIRGKKAGRYLDYYNNDKYVAVNTQHDETIEIRIFQSVLDYKIIVGFLEFCNGLIEAVKLPISVLKSITSNTIRELGRS